MDSFSGSMDELVGGSVAVDLWLNLVEERCGAMYGSLTYDSALFDVSSVHELLLHFERTWEDAIGAPDARVLRTSFSNTLGTGDNQKTSAISRKRLQYRLEVGSVGHKTDISPFEVHLPADIEAMFKFNTTMPSAVAPPTLCMRGVEWERALLTSGKEHLHAALTPLRPFERAMRESARSTTRVTELLQTVLDTVSDLTKRDDVGPTTPLMDAGINSMRATALASELTRQTGVVLPPTLIFQFSTAENIASHLNHQLQVSAGDQEVGRWPSKTLPSNGRAHTDGLLLSTRSSRVLLSRHLVRVLAIA